MNIQSPTNYMIKHDIVQGWYESSECLEQMNDQVFYMIVDMLHSYRVQLILKCVLSSWVDLDILLYCTYFILHYRWWLLS